jgi:hypothetical protein
VENSENGLDGLKLARIIHPVGQSSQGPVAIGKQNVAMPVTINYQVTL